MVSQARFLPTAVIESLVEVVTKAWKSVSRPSASVVPLIARPKGSPGIGSDTHRSSWSDRYGDSDRISKLTPWCTGQRADRSRSGEGF